MKYVYALTTLILALLLAGFISQNSQDVVLKYFFWQTIPLPVSLFMILSFAAGYALAVLVGFSSGIRFRFRANTAEREARQLRSELESLKKEETSNIKADIQGGSRGGAEELSSPTNEGTVGAEDPTIEIARDDTKVRKNWGIGRRKGEEK